MVRDDDDSWAVDEGVGATALGTAAVRAFEAQQESPLFVDPYAQYFLDAVAQQGSTTQYGGKRPEEFSESAPDLADFVRTMTNFTAVRTKFFDDFFTEQPLPVSASSSSSRRGWMRVPGGCRNWLAVRSSRSINRESWDSRPTR